MSNNTLYANVNELYLTYLLNGGMKSIKPESHYSSLRDCADIFFETDKGRKFLSKYMEMDNSPLIQFLKEADISVYKELIAKNNAQPKDGTVSSKLPAVSSKLSKTAFNKCKQEMLDEIYICWYNKMKKYGSWNNVNSATITTWEDNLKKARAEDHVNSAMTGKQLKTMTNTERAIIHAMHMASAFLNWASMHGYKNPVKSWWVNTPQRYLEAMSNMHFNTNALPKPSGGHPLDVMVQFQSGPNNISGPHLLGLSAKSTKTGNPNAVSFKNPSLDTVAPGSGKGIDDQYKAIRDRMITQICKWIEEIDNFCNSETNPIKDTKGNILSVGINCKEEDITKKMGSETNIFKEGAGSTGNRAIYWSNPAWIRLYKEMLRYYRTTALPHVRDAILEYCKSYKLDTSQGQAAFKKYINDVWLNSNAEQFIPRYVKVTGYNNSISKARAVVEDPLDNSKTAKILAGDFFVVPIGQDTIGICTKINGQSTGFIKMRLKTGSSGGGMWATSLKFVGENWNGTSRASTPDKEINVPADAKALLSRYPGLAKLELTEFK